MEEIPYRIDAHHHILPPDYLSAVAAAGIAAGGGRDFPEWSPDDSLALMDRHGIERAIVSLSSPGLYFGNPGATRDLTRLCNEYSAQLIRENPGRFGAFAALPLPDVDASLTELAYALDVLGLQGTCLLTNYGGAYLGNPKFTELFDELNRRKCIVFIHPDVPPGSDSLGLSAPAFMVEFVIDTTRTVSDLLFSGTLERCPDIRFILSHAGGTIPYLALRLSLGQFLPGLQEKVPQGVATYLGHLYYDTALSASPHALRSLQELVEPSHILFGSDYPFAPELATIATIEGLRSYDGFDERTLKEIEQDNALSLFSEYRSD
jgi:predicted TIM-barrel fold metal-dependent hydrolase